MCDGGAPCWVEVCVYAVWWCETCRIVETVPREVCDGEDWVCVCVCDGGDRVAV